MPEVIHSRFLYRTHSNNELIWKDNNLETFFFFLEYIQRSVKLQINNEMGEKEKLHSFEENYYPVTVKYLSIENKLCMIYWQTSTFEFIVVIVLTYIYRQTKNVVKFSLLIRQMSGFFCCCSKINKKNFVQRYNTFFLAH